MRGCKEAGVVEGLSCFRLYMQPSLERREATENPATVCNRSSMLAMQCSPSSVIRSGEMLGRDDQM